MGQPAARITDNHVCPAVTGIVPHVGGPIIAPCCPTVLIGGQPAARVGDFATCVGPIDSIVQGSATVLIGGKPAARIGDTTTHGGKIVTGLPTVLIGADPPLRSRGTGRVRRDFLGRERRTDQRGDPPRDLAVGGPHGHDVLQTASGIRGAVGCQPVDWLSRGVPGVPVLLSVQGLLRDRRWKCALPTAAGSASFEESSGSTGRPCLPNRRRSPTGRSRGPIRSRPCPLREQGGDVGGMHPEAPETPRLPPPEWLKRTSRIGPSISENRKTPMAKERASSGLDRTASGASPGKQDGNRPHASPGSSSL